MSKILFFAVSPYLRYAREMTILNDNYYYSANLYQAYDNRLVYCKKGEGGIFIDGKDYSVKSGSLLIWNAGLKYKYYFNHENPMEMLAFNFDYTKQGTYLTMPIPPDIVSDFNRELMTEDVFFEDANIFNKPILLDDCDYLYSKLSEISVEYKNKKCFYTEKCSGLLLWVLSEIASQGVQLKNSENGIKKMDQIIQYIHETYAQKISYVKIGEVFHYHPYYINKLMVQNTGSSLHKYIQNYRISQAIHLIQTTDMPISKICVAVGFEDFSHFSKYFKKLTGRKPSDYRPK